MIFLVVFSIILIFTFIDFLAHKINEAEYGVPGYYFRNKIIFGTLIGLGLYYFIRKLRVFKKALIFSIIISILLQTRYYLEGYSKEFVFLFLGIHFVILLFASYFIFLLEKRFNPIQKN
jgi:hypothetical protein